MSNKCTQLALECKKCILRQEGNCKGIYFNENMNIEKVHIFVCQKYLRTMAKRKNKNK